MASKPASMAYSKELLASKCIRGRHPDSSEIQHGTGQGHPSPRAAHRLAEAIILVDMAVFREEFESVAQSDATPDAFRQLPGLDVVHFARLAVLEDDALSAQPQPTIILWESKSK